MDFQSIGVEWLIEKADIQKASKVRSTKGLLTHVFGRIAAAFISCIFNPLFELITKLETKIDAAAASYSVEVELLQSIDGVGKDSAITIISEIGVNMEVFSNEQHLSRYESRQ